MAEFMLHRVRFFDYQPKAVQSIAADDALKKLAISRYFNNFEEKEELVWKSSLFIYRSNNTIEIWCLKNEQQESVVLFLLKYDKIYQFYFH